MINNWCKNYKPDKNPQVEMCDNYYVVNLKPHCKSGHKAGLWCHVRNEYEKWNLG